MAAPMYRQIADDLRQKIESGELAPGAQLPTELELRDMYDNASRNTIRDAIRWLTTRRLVYTQPGRGTFVAATIKHFIVPLTPSKTAVGGDEGKAFEDAVGYQGGRPSFSHPKVEVQRAGGEVARELRIEEGAMVVSRNQQRFIDNRPSSLQTSFYPMEFAQQGASQLLLAQDIPEGVTKYLEKELGIRHAGYRDRLRVRAPNEGEVDFFKVPDDGTVLMLVIHRTAYAEGDKPIRYTVTVYPADRNQLVIDSGNVPPLSQLIRNLGDV